MKFRILPYLLLALAATGFTSCGDNDHTIDLAPQIIGSYYGTMQLSVPERVTDDKDTLPAFTYSFGQTVTLGSSDENKVSLEITGLQYPVEGEPVTVGNVTLRYFPVRSTPSGQYQLYYTQGDAALAAPLGFREFTASGYVDLDQVLHLELGIVGSAPLTRNSFGITYEFTGSRK